MASSVFLWPSTGQYLGIDGIAAIPSFAAASKPNTGIYFFGSIGSTGSGNIGFSSRALSVGGVSDGTDVAFPQGIGVNSNAAFYWGNIGTFSSSGAAIASIYADTADTIALRHGTNPQSLRIYGYSSGSRLTRGSIHSATEAITLSGASTATSNFIPTGCFVIGVAISITTAITGASGYTAGDGTDVDRYGDITGTAIGTHSDNTNSTANPTGYNASASGITLTAKTSNFTGGVAQVTVSYMTTASA